jgi:cell division septal protein FtsQ
MKGKRSTKRAKKAGRRQAKRGARSRLWLIAGMVVGAALVAGAGWWAAQQPLPELSYFQVSEIEIRGNDHVATQEILSRLGLSEPVNILQLDMKALAARVMTHPWVRNASIQRHLPSRLIVTIEEREAVAVLSMGKTYLLSADAVILEAVQRPPAQALPTIRAQWKPKVRVGEHLSEPRIVRGLALLEALRKAPLLGEAQVEEVTAETDGNYILHLAGGGAIVRLDAAESLPQLNRLDMALARQGHGLESFAYVDLRFPGRVILNPSEKGG